MKGRQSRLNSKKSVIGVLLGILCLLACAFQKTQAQDSIKVVPKPQIQQDSSKSPKRNIETTIVYDAEDSIVMDASNKTAVLYNKAHVVYGSREIKSSQMVIDQNTNLVTANYTTDSAGKRIGVPAFKEGKDQYVAGEIKYNYKSRKGLVKELITQQGEGYVHGTTVKKEPSNIMYLDQAKYTTCNLEHPHFYIKATKLKMIPNKKIVAGPFHMRIADIPTPLAFFFGYFPIPKRRGSGIIVPMYGESRDRGFFLRGGGYYWAVNDNIGATFLTDLYTRGGWSGQLIMDYKKRYAFDGKFNARYNYFVRNPDDDSLRTENRDIWFSWQHRPEMNGRTYSFSAAVNFGTSNFNNNTSYNFQARNQANFNSTITFQKTFRKLPFNLGLSARADQNITTKIMNFDLPTANIGMNRIYPFRDMGIRSKYAEPLKKLNFAYNGTFSNKLTNVYRNNNPGYQVLGADSLYYAQSDTIILVSNQSNRAFTPELARFFSKAKYGISHVVPITTTVKVFKFFNLNPTLNYQENWYQKQFSYTDWNESTRAVKIDTIGFGRSYNYNLGASITTRIYGTFFIKKWGMEALRHTIIPTVGYTYNPNLADQSFQRNVRVDSNSYRDLQRFDNSVVGSLGTRLSRSYTFSLANTFELKVKDKKDTVKQSFKKVTILDNLALSGNYNSVLDSFRLSNLNLTARTRLLNRFDINFNALIDPYAYGNIQNTQGEQVLKKNNVLALQQGGGLGKIISSNLTIGTSFKPKQKKKDAPVVPQVDPWELNYIRNNSIRYLDWSVPWSFSVNYIFSYNNSFNRSTGKFTESDRHNVSFNGDISLSEKWKFTFGSGYDFFKKDFSLTRVGITRDLHCWDINFNWIPFGPMQSYTVDLAVKASTLRDLKLTRRRDWFDN